MISSLFAQHELRELFKGKEHSLESKIIKTGVAAKNFENIDELENGKKSVDRINKLLENKNLSDEKRYTLSLIKNSKGLFSREQVEYLNSNDYYKQLLDLQTKALKAPEKKQEEIEYRNTQVHTIFHHLRQSFPDASCSQYFF